MEKLPTDREENDGSSLTCRTTSEDETNKNFVAKPSGTIDVPEGVAVMVVPGPV